MRRDFFSKPAMARSTASTKSCCSMLALPALPASKAASFMIFARSAPASPAVSLPISSISTLLFNLTSLLWTFRISTRPLKSGLSTSTCLSKRPGRKSAASSTSGRFVAASTITGLLSLSKPSISARS